MTKEKLGNLILSSETLMYHTAKSLLCNDADCADAIQEAIVKAFTKRDSLKNDTFAKTWLIRILMNECYSIMRKEKKMVTLETISETKSYEPADYSDLYQAVSKLPASLQLAVTLYYVEGFSIREIAAIEDTTESSIKNRLYRARIQLKTLLKDEGGNTYEIRTAEG